MVLSANQIHAKIILQLSEEGEIYEQIITGFWGKFHW